MCFAPCYLLQAFLLCSSLHALLCTSRYASCYVLCTLLFTASIVVLFAACIVVHFVLRILLCAFALCYLSQAFDVHFSAAVLSTSITHCCALCDCCCTQRFALPCSALLPCSAPLYLALLSSA
jgi:hypothetical protein